MSESLESRIDFIRDQIRAGEYSAPARECTGIIERAFRELYRQGLGLLKGPDRVRVLETEQQIGGKGGKTVEDFTLGQLVALFRNSAFLTSWASATGNELRGIRIVNFDELVQIRNEIVHHGRPASRSDAELLFHCVQSVLETFGILTLEGASLASTPPSPRTVAPPRRRAASNYDVKRSKELSRLRVQASLVEELDRRAITRGRRTLPDSDLTVLDLGCADGTVTRSRFAEAPFAHVVGVDRSAAVIEQGRAASASEDKFHFIQCDLEAPELETALAQHFAEHQRQGPDLVFSALTLHHLANPVKLLRTCRYLLSRPGAIVVRGSDDGAKIAWPDPDGRMARIVELTLASPGVSDRTNGRKIYAQLYRAGFRSIDMLHHVQDTAGRSIDERAAIFQDSFSFRRNYFEQALEADPANSGLRAQLEEMDTLLDELECEFEDESFYYAETAFAGVALLP